MIISYFTRVEDWLEGWPGAALTIALIVAAVIIIVIAFRGSNVAKALTAAYVFLP